jgi:hypothetical protein
MPLTAASGNDSVHVGATIEDKRHAQNARRAGVRSVLPRLKRCADNFFGPAEAAVIVLAGLAPHHIPEFFHHKPPLNDCFSRTPPRSPHKITGKAHRRQLLRRKIRPSCDAASHRDQGFRDASFRNFSKRQHMAYTPIGGHVGTDNEPSGARHQTSHRYFQWLFCEPILGVLWT